MRTLITILLNGLLVLVVAEVLSGVSVDNYFAALAVGLLLALVNIFIKPLLTLITLPLTILTLGLFLFVVNGLMVLLVDWMIAAFHVENLWWAILFSILISLLNILVGKYDSKTE